MGGQDDRPRPSPSAGAAATGGAGGCGRRTAAGAGPPEQPGGARPNRPGQHGGDPPKPERRDFLGRASRAAMVAGLAAGYGTFGAVAARYLYPADAEAGTAWRFLVEVGRLRVGESLRFRAPAGQTINVTRRADSGTAEDFIALSSTCPHLGCQVHWEPQNNRYFCPCHNGTFDPNGVATGGPPAAAGQSLPRYPLRVEGGLLFIKVPSVRLVEASEPLQPVDADEQISAPGHDPCLAPRPRGGRFA